MASGWGVTPAWSLLLFTLMGCNVRCRCNLYKCHLTVMSNESHLVACLYVTNTYNYICIGNIAGELKICFQDVAFLPSLMLVFTSFLKNCGRGECLGIATCLKTVIGCRQGGTCSLWNTLAPTHLLFVSVEFHGNNTAVAKMW